MHTTWCNHATDEVGGVPYPPTEEGANLPDNVHGARYAVVSIAAVFAGGSSQKCECVCVADSRIPLEVEQCLMLPGSEVRDLMKV